MKRESDASVMRRLLMVCLAIGYYIEEIGPRKKVSSGMESTVKYTLHQRDSNAMYKFIPHVKIEYTIFVEVLFDGEAISVYFTQTDRNPGKLTWSQRRNFPKSIVHRFSKIWVKKLVNEALTKSLR